MRSVQVLVALAAFVSQSGGGPPGGDEALESAPAVAFSKLALAVASPLLSQSQASGGAGPWGSWCEAPGAGGRVSRQRSPWCRARVAGVACL